MGQASHSDPSTELLSEARLDISVAAYWTRKRILVWASLISILSLLPYVPGIVWPMLLWDDFQILRQSWTWHDTVANLWAPANEHSMPLGRLTTWLLVCLAGKLSWVAFAFAWQGPLALLGGLVLIYHFVRRELGHPFAGLLAMGLFGLSGQYMEAVYWFSASFSVLALDMMLLGLLAAQRWEQTGRVRHLVWAAVWAGLAPGWFAIGILAGPLITLYLLANWRPVGAAAKRVAWRLVPVGGTFLGMGIILAHNAVRLFGHQPHLGSGEALYFDPVVGGIYVLRFLVDVLLPGVIGLPPYDAPAYMLGGRLVLALVLAGWGWYWARERRLLVLGTGFVVLAAWLTFSGRASFTYHQIHAWKRYRLLPHLGIVFYLCGCMVPWLMDLGRRWGTAKSVRLAWCAVALQIVLQLPQTLYPPLFLDPGQAEQAAELRRAESVGAVCRAHRISIEQARQVLPLPLSYCDRDVDDRPLDGYVFIEGSYEAQEYSLTEVQELLEDL